MSSLSSWISPDVMHRMAWSLIHFTWQGTAIAGLTATVLVLCERPATRYALCVCALVAMLAAPVLTFLFLADTGTAIVASGSGVNSAVGLHRAYHSADILPWLTTAWFFGVTLFGLRASVSILILEHGRHRRMARLDAGTLAACRKLQGWFGLDRTIRFLTCDWLQAPAVIGWFRPIVLLPLATLAGLSPEQLELVIAHELAHIKRLDPFVNLFQFLVESLLFYHPAVWWLNRRIRAEREICCDEIAVAMCGQPIAYARALTLMEEWRAAPLLAMAANRSPLSNRILHILGRADGRARLPGLAGGLLLLGTALLAGNLSFGLAAPIAAATTRAVSSLDAREPARLQTALAINIARPSVPHKMLRMHGKKRGAALPEHAGNTDVAMAEQAVEIPASPVRSDPSEASLEKPATGEAHVQLVAVVAIPDPMVCRSARPLPGSRFYGPKTCLPKSEWASLEEKGQDISPDGRQVMEATAYDKNHVQLACRPGTVSGSSNSMQYTCF